jgi:hypothetical protein
VSRCKAEGVLSVDAQARAQAGVVSIEAPPDREPGEAAPFASRQPGRLAGLIHTTRFFEPLPEEELQAWEAAERERP